MAKVVTARIPDEIYTKITNSQYSSVSECINVSLRKLFDSNSEPVVVYNEYTNSEKEMFQKNMDNFSKMNSFL